MFEESITNLVNIVLAVAVVWVGFGYYSGATGRLRSVSLFIILSGLILGVAEFIDMFQIFPDGSYLSGLMYEKEILVLIFLFLAVKTLKKVKK